MTELKKEVTITQLIYIKSLIEKKLLVLINDMKENSTISYPITNNLEVNDSVKKKALKDIEGKTVNDLKITYNEFSADLVAIENTLEEYNYHTKITINGEEISISKALRFNNKARDRFTSEINLYKALLRNSKTNIKTTNGILVQIEPTFNVAEIEESLENYQKTADTISAKIEEKNSQTAVEFPNAYKYLTE